MKKIFISILVVIVVLVVIFLGLRYKREQARTAEEKKLKDEYVTTLKITGATIYSQSKQCGSICYEISQIWKTAIEYSADFQKLIRVKMDTYKDIGLYDELLNNKKEIDINMKKLINPPADYERAYDLMLEMYGYYIQLFEQASSPTGSLMTYTRDVNEKLSELEQVFNKITVVVPEVKEEVKLQEKK